MHKLKKNIVLFLQGCIAEQHVCNSDDGDSAVSYAPQAHICSHSNQPRPPRPSGPRLQWIRPGYHYYDDYEYDYSHGGYPAQMSHTAYDDSGEYYHGDVDHMEHASYVPSDGGSTVASSQTTAVTTSSDQHGFAPPITQYEGVGEGNTMVCTPPAFHRPRPRFLHNVRYAAPRPVHPHAGHPPPPSHRPPPPPRPRFHGHYISHSGYEDMSYMYPDPYVESYGDPYHHRRYPPHPQAHSKAIPDTLPNVPQNPSTDLIPRATEQLTCDRQPGEGEDTEMKLPSDKNDNHSQTPQPSDQPKSTSTAIDSVDSTSKLQELEVMQPATSTDNQNQNHDVPVKDQHSEQEPTKDGTTQSTTTLGSTPSAFTYTPPAKVPRPVVMSIPLWDEPDTKRNIHSKKTGLNKSLSEDQTGAAIGRVSDGSSSSSSPSKTPGTPGSPALPRQDKRRSLPGWYFVVIPFILHIEKEMFLTTVSVSSLFHV